MFHIRQKGVPYWTEYIRCATYSDWIYVTRVTYKFHDIAIAVLLLDIQCRYCWCQTDWFLHHLLRKICLHYYTDRYGIIMYDMILYDMWCDVILYDVIWCDMIWYNIWCDVMLYDVIWYDMWCDIIWNYVMRYDMM